MLTTKELGLKATSKTEIYRLLTPDGRIYLPPIKEANHHYISDIISGKKLV